MAIIDGWPDFNVSPEIADDGIHKWEEVRWHRAKADPCLITASTSGSQAQAQVQAQAKAAQAQAVQAQTQAQAQAKHKHEQHKQHKRILV